MWNKCLNTGPEPPHLCDGNASSMDFMIPGGRMESTENRARHRLRTMHPSYAIYHYPSTVVAVVILTVPR